MWLLYIIHVDDLISYHLMSCSKPSTKPWPYFNLDVWLIFASKLATKPWPYFIPDLWLIFDRLLFEEPSSLKSSSPWIKKKKSPQVLFPSSLPVTTRGGFESGGSGIGQNRYPSVENKFMDNLSVDRFGRSGRLSGFGGWVVGRVVGFK